jgi:hypothetical protein
MPCAALEGNRMQINHSCSDRRKDRAQLFSAKFVEELSINLERLPWDQT